MYYILLVVSTLMATGKAIFCKTVGKADGTKKGTMLLNFEAFVIAFLLALAFTNKDLVNIFNISTFSLILSIVFGLSVAFTQITQVKAMGSGPASMVTLIYACGFLFPIIFGAFAWGESITPFQIVGVVILLFAIFLIVGKKEEKSKGISWIIFAVLAMCGSGLNAILQKTHQYSDFSSELNLFLVYAMLFSALFTGIATLLIKEEKTEEKTCEKGQIFLKKILPPLGLGICVGSLNFLNLIIAGQIPSVIMFPVYNVGSMILTAIISALIFKDKTTSRQNLGFIIGIIAILIIGLL